MGGSAWLTGGMYICSSDCTYTLTGLLCFLPMAPPCVKPLALYRRRDPHASDLWRLMDEHFETFQHLYDDRFQAKYGYWRPVVERSVAAWQEAVFAL